MICGSIIETGFQTNNIEIHFKNDYFCVLLSNTSIIFKYKYDKNRRKILIHFFNPWNLLWNSPRSLVVQMWSSSSSQSFSLIFFSFSIFSFSFFNCDLAFNADYLFNVDLLFNADLPKTSDFINCDCANNSLVP